MRKLFCAYGLASALVFALSGQASVPNFAGKWTLDKSKSQGLATPYKQFERAFMEITQTDKEISLKESFSGLAVRDLPPARPGRGGNLPVGADIYNLDGNETVTHIGRSKYTRKAILSNDGKTLELVEKTTSPGSDGGEVTRTQIDKLSLSDDGKVLTVIRSREGPGPQNSTLVYHK